jgi:hypothetical protein
MPEAVSVGIGHHHVGRDRWPQHSGQLRVTEPGDCGQQLMAHSGAACGGGPQYLLARLGQLLDRAQQQIAQ